MMVTWLSSRVPRPMWTCGPNNAKRADFDVVVDLSPGIDRANVRRHNLPLPSLPLRSYSNSAVACVSPHRGGSVAAAPSFPGPRFLRHCPHATHVAVGLNHFSFLKQHPDQFGIQPMSAAVRNDPAHNRGIPDSARSPTRSSNLCRGTFVGKTQPRCRSAHRRRIPARRRWSPLAKPCDAASRPPPCG